MLPKLSFLLKRNFYFDSALGECRQGQSRRTHSVKQQLPAAHPRKWLPSLQLIPKVRLRSYIIISHAEEHQNKNRELNEAWGLSISFAHHSHSG